MAKKKGGIKVPDIKSLQKKYGAAAIPVPDTSTEQLWIPFDSLAINYLLGGGLPYGRVIETAGYESTGKSLLILNAAKNVIKLGGRVLWGDHENTWSNAWAEKNGLDPSKVTVYNDNDIEGLSDWVRDMSLYWRSQLTNNEPILVVADSIAALETTDNIEADQKNGKAQMGNRAKAIDQMYRKRVRFFAKYGITFCPINQVREKLGAGLFEDSTTTPGGKATAFYSTIRLMLVRSKAIKHKIRGKEKKVGQNIYVRVVKNKISPPKDSLKTEVYFRDEYTGYVGYSKYAGLADAFEDEGIVTKKGSRYYLDDSMIANGEEAFTKKLATDSELRKKLIKLSSINTLSKTRALLDELEVNLFPVDGADDSEEEDDDEG